MLKFISILTIICYSVCFIGCGENEGMSSPSISEYEKSLKEDADIQELLAIRDEMISRALKSSVSGAVMAEIVKRNDEDRFASILGYTEDEMANLGSRIARLGESIRNRYPGLADMAGNRAIKCPECEFKNIAERWDNLLVTNKRSIKLGDGEQMIPTPDPSQKGVTCQWASYTASLVACTVFGLTPLYFACAIVALCQFCSGGWITDFCQQ
jgi:hypothetical protein